MTYVPSLPPTPPAHKRTTISKTSLLESMTTLNPASNTFTLSIPLLGRAKVPLDSVLGLRDSKKRNESLFRSDINILIPLLL